MAKFCTRLRADHVQDMCWVLPARRYASTGNSDRNMSVRLSVASRYCVKTKKASVMISSSGSPTVLVFWRQILCRQSKGFPLAGPQTRVGWENSAIF